MIYDDINEKKEGNTYIKICKNIKFILILNLIFFFIISLLYSNINYISKIKFLISYLQSQNDFKKNDIFLKFCKNNKLKKIRTYKEINNPKISIISPLHNRERYILRFIKCIQNQNFKDIEIILVDDFSIDNTVKIIERFKKKDERIILIKNKKNKGTFISRNLGVLYAKGNYVVLPDPDDILSKNILSICYKYAQKYKYEIIRFNMYTGNGKITLNEILKNIENGPIYQPNLISYLFYGNNELDKIDYHICNKLIKTEVYIRAINSINNYYLNMYIIYRDDSIINYMIYRTAKSFYFIKRIGYYYIINSLSVTNNLFPKSNLRIKFAFILLKIIFEYSKNTKYEKDMFNFLFTIFEKKFNIGQKLSAFAHNTQFFYNIIDIYIKSKFITKENKYILQNFKEILKKYKSQIT